MSFFSKLGAAIWPNGQDLVKPDIRDWAATVEAKIDGDGWTTVAKQADEAKTSDATLADDAELVFAMAANTKYMIDLLVLFDTAATPDFKYRHTGPASPTLVRLLRENVVPEATAFSSIAVDEAYSSSDVALTGSGDLGGLVRITGIVHNGANSGNFAFQWAQNTSNGSAATVRAGSRLRYRKVTP